MDPKLLDRITYLALALVGLGVGFLLAPDRKAQVQPPALVQPAAPAIEPAPPAFPGPFCPRPRCPGDCAEAAIRASQPFTVTCPYCRNTLTVKQPVRPTGDLPPIEQPLSAPLTKPPAK